MDQADFAAMRPVTPIDFEGGLAAAFHAPGGSDPAALERSVARLRRSASDLRGVVSDASAIKLDLRALRHLLKLAAENEMDRLATDSNFVGSALIVADCLKTMADRLDAMEARAEAAYAPIVNDVAHKGGAA